jgi:hypothetical protein
MMRTSEAAISENGISNDDDVTRDPEHRLMLAVLEDALMTFQSGLASRVPTKRQHFCEVERWIRSRDTDSLFSFENICSVLKIDPDYVRAGLVQLKKKGLRSCTKQPRLKLWRQTIQDRRAWKGQIG